MRIMVRLQAVSLVATVVLIVSAQSATEMRQAGRLALHQPVERDLAAGQTDIFTVDVASGQFMHMVVQKKGVNAVVVLADPDGKAITTADSANGTSGLVPASLIVGRDGIYSVQVAASPRGTEPGSYRIELTDLHVPTEPDRTRLQAETEFFNAVRTASEEGKQKQLMAVEGYQRAAALWHELHEDDFEALCLHRAGSIYRRLDEHRKAVELFNRALPLWRAAGDGPGEASSLNNMANSYSELGQRQQVLDYYNQALALWRAARNRASEAMTLTNIGFLYSNLGEPWKALDYYNQALPLRRAAGDRVGEAMTLHNMGIAYADLGERQKSLDHYNQALQIWRALANRVGEADTLYNMSGMYLDLGDKQKAIEYFNQVLPVFQSLGSRRSESLILLQRGELRLELGEKHKALDDFLKLLPMARAMEDRSSEASALNDLGEVYLTLKDRAKALQSFQQALALRIAIGDRAGQAETFTNLGVVNSAMSKKPRALNNYIQALTLSRAVPDPARQGRVLANLMEYWEAGHNRGLAVFFGKQAINQYQDLRRNIQSLDPRVQRSYLATVSRNYRKLADLLIAQGRLSEAEQVLGLLKEHEYFDYVRRSEEESPSSRHANLNLEEANADRQYREIADGLVAIGVERGNLLAKPIRTEQETQRLGQLEKDIAAGNIKFERFLVNLAQEFNSKPAVALHVEELREAQAIMEDLRELPQGTAAIYTLVGEDKFRAILRTPDVQKAYEYPIKAEDLNRKVLDFRQSVQNPSVDPRPAAEELYKIVIGPLASDLRSAKAQTLMWSLDGVLRYLPLAALYDGKKYLIEQYRVSVMTLASNTRLKDQPDPKWRAAGFGVTKAFEDAPALPSVSAELQGIIATKAGDPGILTGEIKLDDDFTQQSMRETLLKRYPVVHIASHFRFQPGNEAQSFLLLGNGEHLSLAELKTSANLFGGVQILTLSACNTGVGDGVEVEGFGTLAQRQGAKAVVASLWPVADTSTSSLMQEFYRIRETAVGVTKLEALREAQLGFLHGGKAASPQVARGVKKYPSPDGKPAAAPFPYDPKLPFAHPYYWAPFFLMGNWL
jgi:CHAT domain-containing protein/tetratricopeptide (TPR) repeat protein